MLFLQPIRNLYSIIYSSPQDDTDGSLDSIGVQSESKSSVLLSGFTGKPSTDRVMDYIQTLKGNLVYYVYT